jgi:hypothetical protein
MVTAGEPVAVGVMGVTVMVVCGVGVIGVLGVLVTVTGVGEPGTDVRVGMGVNVSTVAEGRGVSDEMGVGVGVINIGAPNSLHPKSGAAPA